MCTIVPIIETLLPELQCSIAFQRLSIVGRELVVDDAIKLAQGLFYNQN